MTPVAPPIFRHDRSLVNTVFLDWAMHWERCPLCVEHDWTAPGTPQISPQPKQGFSPLETARGVVYFSYSPDATVLCHVGQRLYKAWVKKSGEARPHLPSAD